MWLTSTMHMSGRAAAVWVLLWMTGLLSLSAALGTMLATKYPEIVAAVLGL